MHADRLPCTRTDVHDSHDWITMDDGLKLHRCPGAYEALDLPVLPPLPPQWSAPLSETAPVEEQPVLTEEVVPDGRLIEVPERVEGPVPAAGGVVEHAEPFDETRSLTPPSLGRPIGRLTLERVPLSAWDSWSCMACGSRTFERRECCGSPMRPVRVEIHAREVP